MGGMLDEFLDGGAPASSPRGCSGAGNVKFYCPRCEEECDLKEPSKSGRQTKSKSGAPPKEGVELKCDA
eukprot:2652996-Pyramimonas_sp.AAC.1